MNSSIARSMHSDDTVQMDELNSIGMVTHCALNTIGMAVSFMMIFK